MENYCNWIWNKMAVRTVLHSTLSIRIRWSLVIQSLWRETWTTKLYISINIYLFMFKFYGSYRCRFWAIFISTFFSESHCLEHQHDKTLLCVFHHSIIYTLPVLLFTSKQFIHKSPSTSICQMSIKIRHFFTCSDKIDAL